MHLPLLLVVAIVAVATPAAGQRRRPNDLLQVVLPTIRAPSPAHPFVNVVVGFGSPDGLSVDPDTFRARLGRVDITELFRPVLQNGALVGMRAEAGPALLRTGTRRSNRLRVEARSVRTRGTRGRRLRDVDRIRFAAVEAENRPPTALIVRSADVILPGIPFRFDGAQSVDPEQDELTFQWNFDDGTTSTEPQPVHAFPTGESDVEVQLTVSDGQATASDRVTLLACLPRDPGRPAGVFKVEAAGPLEFGGVPLGTRAVRTFTVRNTDASPLSQLRIKLGVDGEGFALDQTELDLAGGESAPVELRFEPTTGGHRTANLSLVACATNSNSVRMLGHAYGGEAPGTGPLPVTAPAFYNQIGQNTFGILPSGERFLADSLVRTCQVPGPTPGTVGAGTGDYCLTDADCAPNGGSCAQSGTCFGGERAGETCGGPAECPGSFCSAFTPFEPVDMCGDGLGGLYLMSDVGSFTDPDLTRETPFGGHLMRLEFDAAGRRSSIGIIGLTTEDTTQLACDGTAASAGGHLYVADYRNVNLGAECFRDGREALAVVRKSNGESTPVMSRIDIVEGLPDCEDYDPVTDLQVTRDGSTVFASMPNGIYRVRPTPQLITPDVDDIFQVHPDGSVIVVTITDQGSTGLIRVYKILPGQAVTGGVLLRNLTPCATIQVPNNRGATAASGRTFLDSFAVERTSPATFDGTILLSFLTTGGGSVLNQSLFVRGTAALASPALSSLCTATGLVAVESFTQLTF